MFGKDYAMPMEDLLILSWVPTNLDEQYHEEVKLRMRMANEEAARQIAKQFKQAKKHYDRATKLPQFNIGGKFIWRLVSRNQVLVRNLPHDGMDHIE